MVCEPPRRRLRFVYYCSGHGYGHATRVSAFACHLLQLSPKPIVHIVSSAPKHVFSDSIAQGALYRCAEIDPVIVQPVAYRVDRQKSVEVLKSFLKKRDNMIFQEQDWLRIVGADCVLSDAAFLANAAGIPSILITNFSFDSVYSYLSTSYVDQCDDPPSPDPELLQVLSPPRQTLAPDVPIPFDELQPMVDAILSGYRCANLLVRLPGAIPIPSFAKTPSLPSPQWVDLDKRSFTQDVTAHLVNSPSTYQSYPHIPFPNEFPINRSPRTIIQAPLLVRSPDPCVWTPHGRRRILDTIGVPSRYQTNGTKILLVSFGGQVFHRPCSRPHSRSGSSAVSPTVSPSRSGPGEISHREGTLHKHDVNPARHSPEFQAEALSQALQSTLAKPPSPDPNLQVASPQLAPAEIARMSSKRFGSRHQSQLLIAGAPPVAITASPTIASAPPCFTTITTPPSPLMPEPKEMPLLANGYPNGLGLDIHEEPEELPSMFPDDTWIAIVCGVSKDWGKENGEELPENFFLAPKDVYMPDLTAIADVLLGKLGYGTVSECVDACTPFVFVPRPLFIEEYGLRLLLDQEGVGVELSRASYEAGEWASAIAQAYEKGKIAKGKKRKEGETGKRKEEGRKLARDVVEWVEEWQAGGKEKLNSTSEREFQNSNVGADADGRGEDLDMVRV